MQTASTTPSLTDLNRATLLALSTAVVMIAQQVAGKATRDALFLSQFEVAELPKVMIASAMVSIATVWIMSRLMARFGPARITVAAFTGSGLVYGLLWLLFGLSPQACAVVLYLHIGAFGAVLISAFWSLVNERFDPHSAKRTVAWVAAGAALGGILGGILAERVTVLVELRAMLIVLGSLHLVCAVGVLGAGAAQRTGAAPEDPRVRSAVAIIRRHGYLQQMALLMSLVAVVAALLDYALKSEAAAQFASAQALVGFFGTFYAVVGIAGFAIQGLAGPRILQRFGIGVALLALPVVIMCGAAAALFLPLLWAVALLRGGHAAVFNSLFRSAFELLYTPLRPGDKRPSKPIIDVAADRVGDALGSGLVLLILTLVPDPPAALMIGIATAFAGGVLLLVRRLYRGYVGQLATNLRHGAVSIHADEVMDATTARVLSETSPYAERELLMRRIAEMRARRSGPVQEAVPSEPENGNGGDFRAVLAPWGADAPPPIRLDAPGLPGFRKAGPDRPPPLVAAVADLTTDEPDGALRVLRGPFMDIRLAAHLIPLLDREELAQDVRMELRWMAPRIIGQLTDALLDPDLSLAARQRVPGVLEICHNFRSVAGLVLGLGVNEFNIRYSCARALARMRVNDPAVKVNRREVYAAALRELRVDDTEWNARIPLLDEDPVAGLAIDREHPAAGRRFEHVFTLFGLVEDQQAVHTAMRAVFGEDPHLRGTALEFLENILPENVRGALWSRLGDRTGGMVRAAAPRSPQPRTARAQRQTDEDV